MFDKSKNNIKKVNLQINKLYQNDNLLLSTSLIEMMSNDNINKQLKEKLDYQDKITTYYNRQYENNIKKQYNPKVTNLYYDGIIVLDKEEYLLKDFFIVFNDELNNFHLKCINQRFNNDEIDYNRAVRFIDTTAFINLINNAQIVSKKLIINDKDCLNTIIKNWDGYLHGETKETDAIMNKKMIRDDQNE